jgi:glycosyltransferase involved in cell wall biosynthesis
MEKPARVNPRLSVVIPAFNAESSIDEAVRAVLAQPLTAGAFECIVVDDGSRDRTAEAAQRAGAMVVRLAENCGPSAARNAGIEQARGEWIAFTDADCVPSRRWLPALLEAAQGADRSTLGLAGSTVGLDSKSPAARFMDLTGALDAEVYMRQGAMPWAPSCNLAYRRADLLAVGGFAPAFRDYETPELHWRLTQRFGGEILRLPLAVVMHRHRPTWRGLFRQQMKYGRGYGHFFLRHADRWRWSFRRETAAWARLFYLAVRAVAGWGEPGLVRRGLFLKHAAQRIGFVQTFYSPRWRRRCQGRMAGSGLPLGLAVGHFILRAPARMSRSGLPAFLARVAAQRRDGSDAARITRLTRRWLRLPSLRSRDTCYLRSLVLFRFADSHGADLCLHFGVDEPRETDDRLYGHAWVSLNGIPLNPPESLAEGRLREIYRFSTLTGGASASGAEFAAAMLRRDGVGLGNGRPAPV